MYQLYIFKNRIRKGFRTFKNFYGKFTLLSVLLVFALVFLFLLLLNPIIQKDALFWFFSSVSQSMAAVFAVIGMFAVFRYEYLSNKLKEDFKTLRDEISIKQFPIPPEAYGSFHVDYALLDFLEDHFKDAVEKKKQVPAAYTNVRVFTMNISHKKKVLDHTKELALIPMTEVLIAFILSVVSLLAMSSYFGASGSIRCWGITAIILTSFLVILSMISIMKYFKMCFPKT